MLAHAFQGFDAPRYTQVPDQLFDELLPHLSGAELKVLLYIIRRTFGFKKDSDSISLNQICHGITTANGRVLDQGTGLHESTVLTALKGLVAQNIILAARRQSAEKGYEPTTYCLNLRNYNMLAPPFPDFPGRGPRKIREALPGKSGIQETVLQETVLQETVEQETDHSNIRMVPTAKRNVGNSDAMREGMRAPAALPAEMQVPLALDRNNGPLESFAAPASNGVVHSQYGPERQQIVDYIADFAREFSDAAPAKSSVTRAVNLFRRSGLELEDFCEQLYAARAVVKERTAAIKTTTTEPGQLFPTKRKMGYFFAVLEDTVGLKSRPSAIETPMSSGRRRGLGKDV